jgi:hypothetical protein
VALGRFHCRVPHDVIVIGEFRSRVLTACCLSDSDCLLIQILVNLEKMKVLASGLLYLFNTYWQEYNNAGRSGRDGRGNYSKVSINADESNSRQSEMASKHSN